MTPVLHIERAAADLRRGSPIILNTQANRSFWVLAVETSDVYSLINTPSITSPVLLLTPTRINWLNTKECGTDITGFTSPLPHSQTELEQFSGLDMSIDQKIDLKKFTASTQIHHKAALELIHIAEIVPALVIAEVKDMSTFPDLISVDQEAIFNYRQALAYDLSPVITAPLTLLNAHDASITAFRPTVGGCEHYAITVGTPDKESPLIRLHSSCYTGDLLGSLCCDCRDQLQEAIKLMSEKGGGVILYLLQDGRGIGLTNKLRTYQLQSQGLDTVDANRALGFADDLRLFAPAAKMLEHLGYNQVSLLTNNPRKARDLETLGIKVKETVAHHFEPHVKNKGYLETKAQRMGHEFK